MPPLQDAQAHTPLTPDWPQLGLKATPPRMKVLDIFRHSATRHLCAEDVYRALVATGEALSLSTVYKALSQFEQVGLLTRSELGHGHTVFELTDPQGLRHGHLLCVTNGEVTELHLPELEQHLRALAKAHGLDLTHWALTAWGRPIFRPGGSGVGDAAG